MISIAEITWRKLTAQYVPHLLAFEISCPKIYKKRDISAFIGSWANSEMNILSKCQKSTSM